MSIFLSNFQKIRPRYEMTQENILRWIAKAHAAAEAKKENWEFEGPLFRAFLNEIQERCLKLGLGANKIEKRAFQLPDVMKSRWEEMEIFALDLRGEGRGIRERASWFDREVESLFDQFYPKEASLAPHLIHVTCTGYAAPSAAQRLVSKRGFGKKTAVTHAYHMGCYASIPAIRMASGFTPHPVDIVHTEISSLHMNPLLHSTEQLIVQSLFADGFIKYQVSPKKEAHSLEILSLQEEILPDSGRCMSWNLEEWGFSMTLAKEVPVLISRALPSFLERLSQNYNLKEALFAIHPGGPKIIEQVGKLINAKKRQLFHSSEILRRFGNMSSATLPHIWESIVCDASVAPGTSIVSLAFGPGLTISGGLFVKR